jgi:hypothetical protein
MPQFNLQGGDLFLLEDKKKAASGAALDEKQEPANPAV